MFKWLFTIVSWDNSKPEPELKVGSRVRTKEGDGTIVGGTVHIKFDSHKKLKGDRHESNRVRSFNLDNIELL